MPGANPTPVMVYADTPAEVGNRFQWVRDCVPGHPDLQSLYVCNVRKGRDDGSIVSIITIATASRELAEELVKQWNDYWYKGYTFTIID